MADQAISENRGLSLWDIDKTITELMALREEAKPEEIAAIDGQIEAWVEQEVEKVERCRAYIRHQEQQADMAKEWAQEAQRWQRVHEGRADRVREMVKRVMDARGLRRLEGPSMGSFTVRKNGGEAKLEITDEAAIPDLFRRVKLEISRPLWERLQAALAGDDALMLALMMQSETDLDKAAIRAALESGTDVPGARLGDRGTHLMVR